MSPQNQAPQGKIDPRTIQVPKPAGNIPQVASGAGPTGSAAANSPHRPDAPGASTLAGLSPAGTGPTASKKALDAPDVPTPREASWSAVGALQGVLTHKTGTDTGKHGRVVIDQYGAVHVELRGGGNPYLLRVGSPELQALIRQLLQEQGKQPNKANIAEVTEGLQSKSEIEGVRISAWRRVGQRDDGTVVINLGDKANTQVWISPNTAAIVTAGSDVCFARPHHMLPMPLPAEGTGKLPALRKYVNLSAVGFVLYTAWLTYTLAHAKGPGSKYVILVLNGGQGSGKSLLSRATIQLADPSRVGLQVLPRNVNDLAIAGQNAHVVAYDNVRDISTTMSDHLCVASTGGDVSKRQLYTDADLHVLSLHFAVILNGIPSFVEQPDLAQRCLVLRLQPMEEAKRRSEAEMWSEFETEMPQILGGVFDLIAKVLAKLPEAKVTHPARMVDFSRWLAAMELVDGVPAGIYQQEYVDALNEGQRDSLQENVLAAVLLDAIDLLTQDGTDTWLGTPADLLEVLSARVSFATQRSRDWPANPIALSKRLQFLQAPFMTQGVEIQFRRSKERLIGIKKIGGAEPSP